MAPIAALCLSTIAERSQAMVALLAADRARLRGGIEAAAAAAAGVAPSRSVAR